MPNVAYGSGTHVCIGEYLSLVELECAFKGLFTRMPNLKVNSIRWPHLVAAELKQK
jgi:cytochrome P450